MTWVCVNEVYAETDVAVMHGYPMYAEGWSMSDLDPDLCRIYAPW